MVTGQQMAFVGNVVPKWYVSGTSTLLMHYNFTPPHPTSLHPLEPITPLFTQPSLWHCMHSAFTLHSFLFMGPLISHYILIVFTQYWLSTAHFTCPSHVFQAHSNCTSHTLHSIHPYLFDSVIVLASWLVMFTPWSRHFMFIPANSSCGQRLTSLISHPLHVHPCPTYFLITLFTCMLIFGCVRFHFMRDIHFILNPRFFCTFYLT